MTTNNKKLILASIAAFVLFVFTIGFSTGSFAAASGPQNEPLVQFTDLQYLGAFRGPACTGSSCLDSWGASAMGYRPPYSGQPNGSLFVSCAFTDQTMAEISIPPLVNSNDATKLNQATFLQPCSDPRAGATYNVSAGQASTPVGGIIVNGSQLVVSYYSQYDATFDQQASHYVKSSLNLAASDAKGPYAVAQTGVQTQGTVGFTSGPMAWIPSEWRASFGNKLLIAYNGELSIGNRTSHGPAAFAFNPSDLTSVSPNSSTYPANPAPSVPLVYYDEPHQTIGGPNSIYNGSSVFYNAVVVPSVRGLVIPDGTRSALYFQGQAMGPSVVYGGTDCQNQHGYTDPPYHMILLAYDLNNWANSASNPSAYPPYNNIPYAAWDLTATSAFPLLGGDSSCQGYGGGAVYDSAHQILYWVATKHDPLTAYGMGPIIYAWHVNAAVPNSSPAAPGNLRKR